MSTTSFCHGQANMTDTETGSPVSRIRLIPMFTAWLMPPSSLRMAR
jgi:hypothetical protein